MSTFAPASSSFFFMVSESALLTPSLTVPGTPSTRSFASFRPRPVSSRTTLMTPTFLSAGYSLRTTVNSVFSSTGAAAAAAAAPPPAAIATGAAAVTPNFFSMSEMSSTTCMTVMFEIASRISSFETAIVITPKNLSQTSATIHCDKSCGLRIADGRDGAHQLLIRRGKRGHELLDRRLHDTEKLRQRLNARGQTRNLVEILRGEAISTEGHEGRDQLFVVLREGLDHAR